MSLGLSFQERKRQSCFESSAASSLILLTFSYLFSPYFIFILFYFFFCSTKLLDTVICRVLASAYFCISWDQSICKLGLLFSWKGSCQSVRGVGVLEEKLHKIYNGYVSSCRVSG